MVVCCFIAAVIAAVCGIALLKFRLTQKFEPYGLPPPLLLPQTPNSTPSHPVVRKGCYTKFLSC